MGKVLYEKFESVKALFEQADSALGFSIKELCFEGPEEELRKTYNTQPAILTVSVACYQVLKEQGILPDIVAGHSLGEYSALVAAGALEFADAVKIVRKRGEFMQEAVPLGEGKMAAILGLDKETINAICNTVQAEAGAVQAVNLNCPGQTVIAGCTLAVEKAVQLLKEAGAKKAVRLPVSAPFHSTLMRPAAERLAAELNKITFFDAQLPVVSNVTGRVVTKCQEIKDGLVLQAASPVLWEDSITEMIKLGANTFVEVGPGKVLTGFAKKISKEVQFFNVEDTDSLEKTLDYFREVR